MASFFAMKQYSDRNDFNAAARDQRRAARPLIDTLEPRRLLAAANPLAVNFNDEALWGSNFSTAVKDARALGITAVRLWYGFEYYGARPHAWDSIPRFGSVPGEVDPDALVLKRAFQLHQLGFSVTLVLQQNEGLAPKSAAQVKGMVGALMDSTETRTSTETLASAVDYWEIGNEPDSAGYWQPSAADSAAGLKAYVDQFLIPAAQELHADPAHPERVISAGVSGDPGDLKIILGELRRQHALADIDSAGFHAYGTYNPAKPNVTGGLKAKTELAASYAKAAGKPLMATEWNVRGCNRGSPAAWAKAVDGAYRNVILPNYSAAYYFALVNNWCARGGKISARPAGLLVHKAPAAVKPGSSTAALSNYYNTPLVASTPFYNVFSSWQTIGSAPKTVSLSGRLFTDVNGDGLFNGSDVNGIARVVFLDLNRNGVLDAGERRTATDAAGRYTFTGLAAGNYRVLHPLLGGYHLSHSSLPYLSVHLNIGETLNSANLAATSK